MPCGAVHALIAPPTLTSGASAALTYAASPAIPAPSSIPVTLAPIAAIPHGQDGTQLTAAQLIPGAANYTDNVTDNDILPKQTMRSAFVSASYKVTEQWELSADGRYSTRNFRFTYPVRPNDFLVPASNAFNHLGGPVLVAYDLSRDFGPVVDSGPTTNSFVSASVKGVLPKGWQINLAGAYTKASTEFVESNFALNYAAIDAALASSDPATALNIFGDGSHTNATALAALRGQNPTSDDLNVFTAASANVIADGPLFNWRAGAIRLAIGGEFRHEHSAGTNIAELPEDRERLIRSGFFELAVPVVAPHEGSTSGRLDLSLAGRYDSYSDVGGTFNPKVGFSWRPSALVKLRGNWGTSFLAPPFFWSNRDQVGDAVIMDIVDPRSSTGYTRALTRALLLYGPLPDLKPETARAWNAGVDLTPPAIQNFSLSLTYFDIDYRGKIQPPHPDPALPHPGGAIGFADHTQPDAGADRCRLHETTAQWRELQPTDRGNYRRPVSQSCQPQDSGRGCGAGLFSKHGTGQGEVQPERHLYD